jgi:hypothetical protein
MVERYAKVPKPLTDDTLLIPLSETNPRRPESLGYQHMAILLLRPEGMFYADYRAAVAAHDRGKPVNRKIRFNKNGMAGHHLRWDLAHGRVKIRWPDGSEFAKPLMKGAEAVVFGMDARHSSCRMLRSERRMKATQAAIYLRVSTVDQTTDNQRRELDAAAAARGWSIVAIYEDAAISGAKSRDSRPQLDAMLKDAVRRRFDVVMVWAVDRLGRSLPDLVATMQELHASKVYLFILQQALDTSTPAGRAMFGMLGVFAEFERAMIQSAGERRTAAGQGGRCSARATAGGA